MMVFKIVPDGQVTVWCNEDSPLIWPNILQAVSGHSDGMDLKGADDFLKNLMTPDGFTRMEHYLDRHPAETPEAKQQVLTAFLEKNALAEALEQEIDLPGWTEDYVERLSSQYDEDLDVISQIPRVTLIEP